MTRVCIAALLVLAASPALAHEPSRSLLTLAAESDAVRGRLDVSLRDLEDAVGLDANADHAITWRELEARKAETERYVAARLRIEADGAACKLGARLHAVDEHGGVAYAVLELAAACRTARDGGSAAVARSGPLRTDDTSRRLRISYGLLFDVDPGHRSLVEIAAAASTTTAVLSADRPALDVELATLSSWSSFLRFVAEGVWHIWHGYDHLAFVALLILPIVLGDTFRARDSWRAPAVEIVRVVTAFTAAHSATLALAALGVVDMPARLVEAAIALSVVAAAVMNVVPHAPRLGATLAFGFGLVHGLGFATALDDLGTGEVRSFASLLGFNAGVELGQLAVVAAALPALAVIRRSAAARFTVNSGGSAACGVAALIWLAERL